MVTEVGSGSFFLCTDIGLFGTFVAVTWGRALQKQYPLRAHLRGVSLPFTDEKGPAEMAWAPRVGQACGEVYKTH